MAPYNSDPHYDSYEYEDQNSYDNNVQNTVNHITRIVNQVAQAVTYPTNGITVNDDFGSVNSALDAISGSDGNSISNTIFEIPTTEIIQDIADSNNVEGATTEIIQQITNANSIVETTDFPTQFEKVTKHYFTFSEVDLKNHDSDSLPNNMPYIILVIVLAVLVAVTVIALVVYQRRKSAAITDKNPTEVGIVGKAFNKADEKQETLPPQQIMYGEH